METMTESELRQRLADIDAQLRETAPDAFAEAHALRTEADGLKSELDRRLADEVGDARDAWAERAGRKASHEGDPELAKLRIVSPNEMGGGSI